MRKLVLSCLVATALAACSTDTTSPITDDQLTDFSVGAFGTALTSAGGYDADLYRLRLLHGFPDDIKLTPEQEAKIKALVDAFQTATQADRDALNKILRDAAQAIRSHKSRAEVKAILGQGIAIRARLIAAEAKLRSDIEALLTPEQKAWLAAHTPKRCDPSKFPPLTDAQKAEMKAIEAAFEQSHKADIDAVKSAIEQIKAAILAGKTRAEIQSIVDRIKPAIDRLATARSELRAALEAVLTPEQKASGCLPLG